MTPLEFINKWKASTLRERAGSQSHFNDLCVLIGEQTPTDADSDGSWYTFERGAKKTGGGDGWADVWKRGHFAWEYKGKHKDLNAAFAQLQRYAIALENPPLLVVSDMETIIIHTNFTNTVEEIHVITLDDLLNPDTRRMLKAVFEDPEQLRPGKTREKVTAEAAEHFAQLAQALRGRDFEPHRVAHFMNKMLFCMFAEDARILPPDLFKRMLETSVIRPEKFELMARDLFAAMKKGGNFGPDLIEWFNGGLFNDDDVLPLNQNELKIALSAAKKNWRDVEPSIFGTLFMRGLDPDKRSQLGAEYTDAKSIMRIINPVIREPLLAEWNVLKTEIQALMEKRIKVKSPKGKKYDAASSLFSKETTEALISGQAAREVADPKAREAARKLYKDFLARLAAIRVLDPACGSGNFLYLALTTLKDLEQRVMLEAEVLGLEMGFPHVGPEVVKGIEINAYAAELARATIWIGEIQWMLRHNFSLSRNPILKPLDQIECRDALLNKDGSEAQWPEADFIIGNPPFAGDKKMREYLGDDYTDTVRAAYSGSVPGSADLVTFWFHKAAQMMKEGKVKRTGLVSTQSIRSGSSRKVLDALLEHALIYNAWSDEPWVVEGAAVRVSILCFATQHEGTVVLDGVPVRKIHADLTAATDTGGLDFTTAKVMQDNTGVAFQGPVKVGAFDIPGEQARQWMQAPINPNGRRNSEILRPWANGMDITRRPSDTWIIDFGADMSEADAALYELPFQYVREYVKPKRDNNKDKNRRLNWFRLGRSGEDMRKALAPLSRFILTPRVAKHRLFVWATAQLMPDSRLYAITRDDDTMFGILHSRFHELWSLATCSWHGVGNDPTYNARSCFETFPFPDGLTPNIQANRYAGNAHAQAIAQAARSLCELRDNWLNPPDLVRRVPEVVPGYPDRVISRDAAAATTLKARTLTNLYNERPAWLANVHRALDAAVATAYGWPADLSDEQVLQRLLDLNKQRSSPGAR